MLACLSCQPALDAAQLQTLLLDRHGNDDDDDGDDGVASALEAPTPIACERRAAEDECHAAGSAVRLRWSHL